MTTEPAISAGSVTTTQRVAEIFRGAGFRRFFLARGISQVGDGIFQSAAVDLLLFDDPGANPALRLLILTAITLVPFSILSPFVGVFIDRWERRSIITWVPVVRAVVAIATPFAAGLGTTSPVFLGVVLVVLSANRFFLATMGAVLPQLVPRDDLLVGNSVSSTGGSIANVAGLAAGTALSGVFDGAQAAVFAAGAFAVGALAARRVPVHRGLQAHRAPLLEEVREISAQMVEGLRAVASDARVRFGLSAIGVVQLLVGLMSGILITAFISDLRLELDAAFRMLALLALGIGVGVVVVPWLARRIRPDALVGASFFVSATGVLIATGPVRLGRLTAGTVFLGLAYAFAKIPVDTIVQEEMPDEQRGRAFAIYDMLFNVARVAGVGVAALLFARGTGTRLAITLSAGAYVTMGLTFIGWERLMFKRRKALGPQDLLVPGEMITVRAYAGSRAEEEPRALVVGGREIPVEQVAWRAVVEEPGGRRGRAFVVTVAGRRVRLVHYENEAGWVIERVWRTPVAAD